MKKQSVEFLTKLRETLKPGDTLHTVLRSVSRGPWKHSDPGYALKQEWI